MFEKQSKSKKINHRFIVTTHDIEGWVFEFTHYTDGEIGLTRPKHQPCNTKTTRKDLRYYCQTCNIKMPFNTETIVDTLVNAITKNLPIP